MSPAARPDNPDMTLLIEVATYNDNRFEIEAGAMGSDKEFEKIIGEVVNMDSLTYMAFQRALRAAPHVTMREQARMAAIFMDAFVMGAVFQQRKDRRS